MTCYESYNVLALSYPWPLIFLQLLEYYSLFLGYLCIAVTFNAQHITTTVYEFTSLCQCGVENCCAQPAALASDTCTLN